MYRIGWLNVFNPMRVQRLFMLDFSKPEEVKLLKVLLKLREDEDVQHQRETGGSTFDNWQNPAFYRQHLDERRLVPHAQVIRGWELTTLRIKWLRNEESIPKQGYLQLGWNNAFKSEDCRRELQHHFLVGSKLFTYPFMDNPLQREPYMPWPLEDEASYQHLHNTYTTSDKPLVQGLTPNV